MTLVGAAPREETGEGEEAARAGLPFDLSEDFVRDVPTVAAGGEGAAGVVVPAVDGGAALVGRLGALDSAAGDTSITVGDGEDEEEGGWPRSSPRRYLSLCRTGDPLEILVAGPFVGILRKTSR